MRKLTGMLVATFVALSISTAGAGEAVSPQLSAALEKLETEDPLAMSGKWIAITRSVPACYSTVIDVEWSATIVAKVWPALKAWSQDDKLPEQCVMLRVGSRYMLTDTAIPDVVGAFEYCIPSCTPAVSVIFMPPTKVVGQFYRPAKAPKSRE